MSKVIWKKIPVREGMLGLTGGNRVLSGKGFYISYQDFSKGGRSEVFEDLNTLITGDSKKDIETALYDEETDKWMILWGDHREAYEEAYPSKKRCLEVYKKLAPKYRSAKWSTDD